jgi:hypothetical protein
MDYTTITTAITVAGLVTALAAVGAIKVVPKVAKWGIGVLMSMFR